MINDRIWHPMVKAAEIALALERHGSVTVDLQGEAPVIQDTMLTELFAYLESQQLDISKINVLTGNPLETYNKTGVTFESKSFYEFELFQKYHKNVPTYKNIKYHFGNFVSRTTMPRLTIASHLYSNYKHQTLQTFHYDHSSEYHKTHIELDKLLNEYGPNSVEFNEAVNLLKATPIIQAPVSSYPIIHRTETVMTEISQWYPKFFVDVICETWPTEDGFYVTEKFWRAVATKTPFVIYGSRYVLTNLKKLGFKTFSNYWDEGYQEDFSKDRINLIKQVLKQIANIPSDELTTIYHDMKSILDHNYEIFMNFTHDELKKLSQ